MKIQKENENKYLIKGLDFKFCQVKALASFNKFKKVPKNKKEKQTPNKFISCFVGALGEYTTKIHIEKSMLEQKAKVLLTSTNKKNEFEKQDLIVSFFDENGNNKELKIEVKAQQKGYARCQIVTDHAEKYYKTGIDVVVFAEVVFEKEYFEITRKEYELNDNVLIICSEDDEKLKEKNENDLVKVEKLISAEVEIYAKEKPKNFFDSNKYEIHWNKFKVKTYIRKDCVYMLSDWQKLDQNYFFKQDSEVIYMI
jgi:hypothetical protein